MGVSGGWESGGGGGGGWGAGESSGRGGRAQSARARYFVFNRGFIEARVRCHEIGCLVTWI